MKKVLSLLILLAAPAYAMASTEIVASCDQLAIETARDAAGVGGTVEFPNCTYTVDNLIASVADQTWVMQGDAKFLRSLSTTGPILKLTAPLKLNGGILDGARGFNTNPAVGVDSTGQAFEWRDGVMRNVPSWGVAIDNGEMLLRDIKFSNIKNACVIWRNMIAATMDGPHIDHVRCDRSTESPATITSGGILIHAGAGKWVMNPRIVNSNVILPVSLAYDPVAIEIWNSQHAQVVGNKTTGGRIGYSFSNGAYAAVVANIGQVPVDYAFEFGDGSSQINLQANNATGFAPSRWGVIASQNSVVRAIGNAFVGFTGAVPSGGCTGGSNVCWYTGSSYPINYGN